MKLPEIFQKAREILSDEQHWYKGDFGAWNFETQTGQVCVLGACKVAMGVHPEGSLGQQFDQWEDLLSTLKICVDNNITNYSLDDNDPASFNDFSGTTHEDILQLLDCAIHDTTEKELVKA